MTDWCKLSFSCYCRPLNEDEVKVHTPVAITCHEGRREVSALQNIANKQIDRTFMFDKVCGRILFGVLYFNYSHCWALNLMQKYGQTQTIPTSKLGEFGHAKICSIWWSCLCCSILIESSCAGVWSRIPTEGLIWAISISDRKWSTRGLQLHHFCLWSDWNRENLYNGRRIKEEGEIFIWVTVYNRTWLVELSLLNFSFLSVEWRVPSWCRCYT